MQNSQALRVDSFRGLDERRSGNFTLGLELRCHKQIVGTFQNLNRVIFMTNRISITGTSAPRAARPIESIRGEVSSKHSWLVQIFGL